MRWPTAVGAIATLTTLGVQPAVATTSGVCDGHHPIDDHVVVGADGATNDTNTNVDGVSGDIFVPNWNTTNLRGQATSAADVIFNIQDSAKHYFQLGWYLGEATGLEPASTPRLFFGEGVVSPTVDETLTTLYVPLSTGRYHNFRLQRLVDPDPYYNWHYAAYLDGAQVWTSRMATTIEGTPSVVAETNWQCADLYLRATTPLGGPTLRGHHAGGSWSLWQQNLVVKDYAAATRPHCWTVTRYAGQTATSVAYDTC